MVPVGEEGHAVDGDGEDEDAMSVVFGLEALCSAALYQLMNSRDSSSI